MNYEPETKEEKRQRQIQEEKEYFHDTLRMIIRAFTEKQIREIMEKLDAPYTPRFIEEDRVIHMKSRKKMIEWVR